MNVKSQKGFVQIPILIAIIVGLVAISGYFGIRGYKNQPARSTNNGILQTEKTDEVLSISSKTAKKSPPSKPIETKKEKIETNIVSVYPTICKPTHGFDGYRTDETFVINPQNNREMYVNVEFKGLYKSVDGGSTWQFSGDGLEAWPRSDDPNKPCYMEYMSMYIDPLDTRRVFIVGGAAPGKISEPTYKPGGVHESLDAGKSWYQLFSGDMNAYTMHAITDPKNSKIIYVTTASLPSSNNEAHKDIIFVKQGVVYKSIDAGKSWKELPTGFVPNTRTSRIFISSENPDHLMLGTTAIPPNRGGGQILQEQMGILETKDGGATWKKLEGLPEDFRAVRLFDASANLMHLFVYGQHGNEGEKTFYSLDGGQSFNEVPRPVNFARFDPHDIAGLHLLGFSIYAQPNDFFESFDGGKSWNAVGKLPAEVSNDNRVSNIVWDPIDKNTIFLNGGLGRVWKSTNNGKTWDRILDLSELEK